MKELLKLMEKKKGSKPMDPEYKKAKMGILQSLKDDMSGMMGDEMKGMKKVTVASPDEEGLKKGLEKAEEMLESKEDMSPLEEAKEAASKDSYYDDMSPEDIQMLMDMLQKKKEEMSKKA